MPIQNYGVWKGTPLSYRVDGPEDNTPHINLLFQDDQDNHLKAAINVKSGGTPSELVYWVHRNFSNDLTRDLADLNPGFHPIDSDNGNIGPLALDYFRGNLLRIQDGQVLPFLENGPDNDILDQLKRILDRAISKQADIYLYGSQFQDPGRGGGIHNVHMNQGSPQRQFRRDNGVGRDGGFFLHFHDDDHWEAVFLGFASQIFPTDDVTGQPTRDGQALGDIIENGGRGGGGNQDNEEVKENNRRARRRRGPRL